MTSEYLPDKWFCHMNSDAQFKLVGFDFVEVSSPSDFKVVGALAVVVLIVW
jgi:arginase family enzyme